MVNVYCTSMSKDCAWKYVQGSGLQGFIKRHQAIHPERISV